MLPSENYEIVGSYNNQFVQELDSERSINLFEYFDPKTKKRKSLLPTAGLVDSETFLPEGNNGWRASFYFNGFIYAVVGNNIYQINSDLVGVQLNDDPIASVSGYVGIDANTFQVIFVDGTDGYIFDTNSNKLQKITDPGFPNPESNNSKPIDVCYIDGFFLVAAGGTNTFLLSSYNQGLVWSGNSTTFTASSATSLLTVGNNAAYQTGVPIEFSTTGTLPNPLSNPPPLPITQYYAIVPAGSTTTIYVAGSYADAIAGNHIPLTTNGTPTNTITNIGQLQQGAITSHPGTITGCRTLHRRVFLFSQFFTEVWENQGIGTNLPLRRNNSLLMEYGTPAVGSIATGFDKMFFLSQDRDGLGAVMGVSGTQAIPISNRALDNQLSQYASNPMQGVSDARGLMAKINGLITYRLNFTAANHTFVYNVTLSDPTSEEGKLWHEEQVLNGDRHPAQTHVYYNGINYYGDYQSPLLYIVDRTISTNNGEAIARIRIGSPWQTPQGYVRTRIDRFQLDLLQGSIEEIYSEQNQDILLTETSIDITTENNIDIVTEEDGDIVDNRYPVVFLSYSKDGGQSYGNRLMAPMGQIGQRSFRTVWRKLGVVPRGQTFVPKIEFYNQIPFVILGASWVKEMMPE